MILNPGFDLFLQIWGGVCYLLAKVILGISEGNIKNKILRISGWAVYLAGIPAWVVILASQNNWIVAAVDISSIPTMILGIVIAVRQSDKSFRFFDILVKYFTILVILLGASYSVYCFKGITSITQILEILVTFGFLLGTYLLAKKNYLGWVLFAVMILSMGTLMFIDNKMLLVLQQAISLVVVIYGFIKGRKRSKIMQKTLMSDIIFTSPVIYFIKKHINSK